METELGLEVKEHLALREHDFLTMVERDKAPCAERPSRANTRQKGATVAEVDVVDGRTA